MFFAHIRHSQFLTLYKFWRVFWVDATSVDTVEGSFKYISLALGIENSSAAVKQRLSISKEHWLLVFDNADNPTIDISKYFPLSGNLIITSRNPSCAIYASESNSHVEVDKMETDEAISLLLKVARTDSSDAIREDAERLVSDLGFLALAIDQAGSFIATRKCPLKEYRDTFRDCRDRNRLLRQPPTWKSRSDPKSAVYTTWEISFEMVFQMDDLASQILQLMSYLHYAQIPREIFSRASDRVHYDKTSISDIQWTKSRVSKEIYYLLCARKDEDNQNWDDDIFEGTIDILQSFSLIKRERHEGQAIYTLHPLVSSWTRERLPEREQLPIKQSIVCIMNKSIQTCFRRSRTDLQFQRRMFAHVEAFQEHFPEYFECNEKTESNILCEMINFAKVYKQFGSWKKAEKLEVQIMKTSWRVHGQEHPDTLTSMGNLATTYIDQGRWKEAEELNVQVMETRSRVLGQEHPDTMTSMANLALTYTIQGRWNEAEELHVKVMEMRKRVIGQEHPDTLTGMRNIAWTLHLKGRVDEAIALMGNVAHLSSCTLGKDHPFTKLSVYTLVKWRAVK